VCACALAGRWRSGFPKPDRRAGCYRRVPWCGGCACRVGSLALSSELLLLRSPCYPLTGRDLNGRIIRVHIFGEAFVACSRVWCCLPPVLCHIQPLCLSVHTASSLIGVSSNRAHSLPTCPVIPSHPSRCIVLSVLCRWRCQRRQRRSSGELERAVQGSWRSGIALL
jgi:hypothetical protein